MNEPKIVCFDVETTGLDSSCSAILQFSAIDENGRVLLDTYIKPEEIYFKNPALMKSWEEAAAVNGLYPDDERIFNAPSWDEVKSKIQEIMDGAELYVSYNGLHFDNAMLSAHGISIDTNKPHYDVMLEFAPIFGEYSESHNAYKW